jgi:quercetin dioxygenase-like cupin family protein
MTATTENQQRTVLTHHAPVAIGRFDLLEEVHALRANAQYEATGHTARTLIKGSEFRVTLVVLRQGARMKEHQLSEFESIQTLLGSIRVDVAGAATEHGAAELIVLEPGVARDIVALRDCAFLLSIPWAHQGSDSG